MRTRHQNMMLALRLFIPFMIACILSCVITLVNYGITSDFLRNWIKGLIVACIVIPLGLKMIPHVTRAVKTALGNLPALLLRCVVAVSVAVTMETIVSFAITMAQHGLTSGWMLSWGMSFIKALPAGLVIGFAMTFLVHPWMHRLAGTDASPQPTN